MLGQICETLFKQLHRLIISTHSSPLVFGISSPTRSVSGDVVLSLDRSTRLANYETEAALRVSPLQWSSTAKAKLVRVDYAKPNTSLVKWPNTK